MEIAKHARVWEQNVEHFAARVALTFLAFKSAIGIEN